MRSEREREGNPSDTAPGCEQTCKRMEHPPALPAIGFDAVTYTEKWRRCCGIVHRLFLRSVDIIYRPRRTVQILYALYFVPAFFFFFFFSSSIFPNDAHARGKRCFLFRGRSVYNFYGITIATS